jgi:hypothetical protein
MLNNTNKITNFVREKISTISVAHFDFFAAKAEVRVSRLDQRSLNEADLRLLQESQTHHQDLEVKLAATEQRLKYHIQVAVLLSLW